MGMATVNNERWADGDKEAFEKLRGLG